MLSLFWIFAITGSLVLIIQSILLLIGFGEDGDVDGGLDVDGDVDVDVDFDSEGMDSLEGGLEFPFFTLKSLTGFIGGFGWGGLIMLKAGKTVSASIIVAFIVGIILSLSVSSLLFLLSKLKNSGNLNLRNALGKTGSVYLFIPEKEQGTGIVQVVVQDSLRELKAVSKGEKIPTGARIKVVGVEDSIVVVKKINS